MVRTRGKDPARKAAPAGRGKDPLARTCRGLAIAGGSGLGLGIGTGCRPLLAAGAVLTAIWLGMEAAVLVVTWPDGGDRE